jgi:excinuclease ABC subunit C
MPKIIINKNQKSILEQIAGVKIILKNTESAFGQNTYSIDGLQKLGKQNAEVYLGRQHLGQKLNPLEENNLFASVVQLAKNLGLPKNPRRIECYDISHLSGKYVYGSMVSFVDGRAEKKLYKLFKCPDQNNDYDNHKQVLSRRFQKALDKPDDYQWQLPDLIIVDGGKGQLSSDYQILQNYTLENKVQMVSLAKKEEEIFFVEHTQKISELQKASPSQPLDLGKNGGLLVKGDVKFLVQRIRDEAHRFAITANRQARFKQATKSALDDIDGIGTVTKTKILQQFGSTKKFFETLEINPELVWEAIGQKTTQKIIDQFDLGRG